MQASLIRSHAGVGSAPEAIKPSSKGPFQLNFNLKNHQSCDIPIFSAKVKNQMGKNHF